MPFYEFEYTINNLVDLLQKKKDQEKSDQEEYEQKAAQYKQQSKINTPKIPNIKVPSAGKSGFRSLNFKR